MSELRKKSIRAFVWDFAGNIGMQIVAFVISIILARLLEPEQFGLLGMVMVFSALAQVFMDMGFGSALIQKQNINSTTYSTIFWLNIGIGAFISLGIFFSAELIANFYNEPQLIGITKLLSSVFIISSLANIQRIIFIKKLDFKTQSLINILTAGISGGITLWMAFSGFGVDALIFQKIIAAILTVVSFWYLSSWRPSFVFKLNDVKSIWGFSSKEFLDRIITTVYSKLDVIVIGKLFSSATLGFYTRAFSLNSIIGKFTSTSLDKIFFPLISSIHQDKVKVRLIYLRVITIVGFFAIGISGLLFITADDLFVILFTDKWNQSIIYFKLLVVINFIYPISSLMLSFISGLGYAGEVLKAGIYKKLIGTIAIVIGIFYGIEAFLYSNIVFGLIGFNINLSSVRKVTSITMIEQLNCFIRPLFVGVIIICLIVSFSFFDSIYLRIIFNSIIFILLFTIIVFFTDKSLKKIIYSEFSKIKILFK